LGSQKDVSPRKSVFPSKPKRLVIYKEDLPGFKFDNDIEHEKLPVSKRFLAKSGKGDDEGCQNTPGKGKSPKGKSPKKMIKKEMFIARKSLPEPKEIKEESEEDNASVSSDRSNLPR